jgi:hypothetical protein
MSTDAVQEHLIISVNWKKQLVNPGRDVIFFPPLMWEDTSKFLG